MSALPTSAVLCSRRFQIACDIIDLRRTFRLTLSEAALVACLLDGEAASQEKLAQALRRLDGLTYRNESCTKVMLVYARQKLARYGIEIGKGNRSCGPSIDAENIQRIRNYIEVSA